MPPLRASRLARGLLLAVLVGAPQAGRGQAPPVTVGVALSGGSAKGIAHIGVLRTLERLGIRADVVAGTSMGAAIGGMYAIGLSVDSIESVIASADWPALMNDATPRSRRSLEQRRLDERAILTLPLEGARVTLPSGAIIGSNVMRLLEDVFWSGATIRRFRDLPIPFVAVATDLETGEAVPLREGVLAEALRASTGVPGAIEPILLGDRLLVDGALSRNLPATDARELGADFVICSDVSEPIDAAEELESFVDVLSQLASLAMLESTLAQRATCDVLVLPDVEELSGFDFDRVEEWVRRGEVATLEHEADLRALAARPRAAPRVGEHAQLLDDSVRITSVTIAGTTDPRAADLVLRELELTEGDYVGRERMETRIAGLESIGLFGLLRYRLDQQADGVSLTVTVEERPRDRLGVGLRYDDDRRAALLFTATIHNVLVHGSVARLDLRVGEESRIAGSLRRRRGLTGRLGVGVGAGWSQAPLRLSNVSRETIGVDLWTGSVAIGLATGLASFLGVEGVVEQAEADSDSASARLAAAAVVVDHETLDRIDFPRRGADATARFEWGISDVTEGGRFAAAAFDARAFMSFGSRLTVDLGAYAGYTHGADLPAHRRLFLGGAHRSTVFHLSHPTFQGLASEAHTRAAVQVGKIGIRVEPATDWFVRAGVDVGAARDEWRWPLSRPMTGWALAGGFRSRIGPIIGEVSRVWGRRHDARLSVSVGRGF